MPAAIPLAVAAVGAVGAARQASAAKKAAGTQARSADAAVAEQQRQFDTALQLQAPQRAVGNDALNKLAVMLGVTPFNQQQADADAEATATSLVGDTQLPVQGRRIVARDKNNFDVFYGDQQVGQLVRGGPNGKFLSNGAEIPQPKTMPLPTGTPGGMPAQQQDPNAAFFASPDYQFRRDEGLRDIGNQFAARGGARSGNALRALAEYNSNLASGEFGNRFNRLAALAGIGQTANSQGANNAILTGRGVAGDLQAAGSARASGVAGSGAAIADGISGLAGIIPLIQDARQQRNMNQLRQFRGLGGV